MTVYRVKGSSVDSLQVGKALASALFSLPLAQAKSQMHKEKT